MEIFLVIFRAVISGIAATYTRLFTEQRGQLRHKSAPELDESVLQARTHILFLDDDIRFKVAEILQRSGWTHCEIHKDVSSLTEPILKNAHIIFVDIQGVGKQLDFADEGLGLAAALKEKYPQKKIVIYSAETQGQRFHRALRLADDFLWKNADPYQFERLVERLANDIHSN